jgi:hypothetical protein
MRNFEMIKYYPAMKGAEPFVPHSFETKMYVDRLVNKPEMILMTPEAYRDMVAIAKLSGTEEISALGTVLEISKGHYLIDSIHLPKQEVDVSGSAMTEDGLTDYFADLAETDEGFELNGRMFFWGHVHPDNSTRPSPQDEKQMELFRHNDYFIRGIFGRQGRAEFTFFDYVDGVHWTDIPWNIYVPVDDEILAQWRKKVKAQVTRIIPPPIKGPVRSGRKKKYLLPLAPLNGSDGSMCPDREMNAGYFYDGGGFGEDFDEGDA